MQDAFIPAEMQKGLCVRATLAVNWTNLESEGLGGEKDSLSGSLSKASQMPDSDSEVNNSLELYPNRDNLNQKHCKLQELLIFTAGI